MTFKEDQECHAIIFFLAKYFNFECWICHKKCVTGKGFTIHHRKYKKGEKRYKDFIQLGYRIMPDGTQKTTKKYRRLAYLKYLIPIVIKEPERFCLLMHTCHLAVDQNARWKPENLERLFELAVEQSITKRIKP